MLTRNIRVAVLAACLCCAAVAPAQAEELTPARRQEVLRLVEAMGGKELIMQFVHQNMNTVKKFRPDITPEKAPLVEREISAMVSEKIAAPGGLAEQLLPVFAKRFTPQELRELTAFYESPTGRKVVSVMPGAMKEARDVAQRMAIGMIPELNQRVTDVLKRDAGRSAEAPGGTTQQ
ncbi:MAG TPA: DUF2059 domain-containing protein [Humidesulfovibrio sp.]|uniref:DUF2059 domain-containing protein n=1 Tax=Humidesulfovibrio sp. TaxID=2910988 RepID=UPI002C6219D1|nr:DUF2059 domain-containing protein [Humidesulfovibrio sp.]HWR03598.1 DUF2059 domain-containing protein [Humidesulfovibrio sp.]